MIEDKTLDEALLEVMRTKKALEALRTERKACLRYCPKAACEQFWKKHHVTDGFVCSSCLTPLATSTVGPKVHAAAKRATMDLTRKLADLRAGR